MSEPTEAEIEWRERIGVRVMHAMTCTHEGADFGAGAVCVTCFANTQRIGALIERECADAKADGVREAADILDATDPRQMGNGNVQRLLRDYAGRIARTETEEISA